MDRPGQRRRFLTLMGASLALAGLGGCSRAGTAREDRALRPAAGRVVPGKPLFFATAMPLARLRDRRAGREPRGPADQDRGQPAAPRQPRRDRRRSPRRRPDLYDPDRSQAVTHRGAIRAWDGVRLVARLCDGNADRRGEGAGLRILTETVTSPTLGGAARRQLLQGAFPQANWHRVRAGRPRQRSTAARARLRRAGQHRLPTSSKADVVLSLDADFLAAGPARCATRATSATRRRVRRRRAGRRDDEPALRRRERR